MTVDVLIESIGETKSFGANGFRKREMVATTLEGEYAQPLVFEFIQDKTDLLNDLSIGQEVSIDFNLKGNRWQPEGKPERIFMSLQGWRIEKKALGEGQTRQEQAPANNQSEDTDDLPF